MSTVRSTYSGFVGHEGVPTRLVEGEEYDASWSLVKARPELFTSPPPQRPAIAPRRKTKAPSIGSGSSDG